MKWVALNTPQIANSGVTLVGASTTALAGEVGSLATGGHPPLLGVALAFAGIVLGCAMCYVGRPSTIPPPESGGHDAPSVEEDGAVKAAAPPQEHP